MVATFSQLDFRLMVCTVLLFEVSSYYYPIAEFKINPQTYLTTPKLRNFFFFNIPHTSLTKKTITLHLRKQSRKSIQNKPVI